MSKFAQSNPIVNSFWAETEDVSLLDATLLSLGVEPFALEEYKESYGEPINVDELPEDFWFRLQALRSAIRTGKFKPVTLSMDNRERYHETKTRITMAEFLGWCEEKGISVTIPGRKRPAPVPECEGFGPVAADVAQQTMDKSLSTKERETLLKLVIGMAIDGYGYDPQAPKSALTGEGEASLHAQLQLRGLSVDPDTIRKYLKEAKALLPPQ